MPNWLLKSRLVNNQGKCNDQIMLNVALTKSAILTNIWIELKRLRCFDEVSLVLVFQAGAVTTA
jgi:hypothetical protein